MTESNSTLRFDDRVAIVTGAGNGLGRAYALLLAARGAKVLVNDLGSDTSGQGADLAVAEAVVEEIRRAGGQAKANGDTVSTADGGNAIVAQALDHWGKVDILVNNAGLTVASTGLDGMSDEVYAHDMDVAAGGTFHLSRAVWRHMIDRDYGRIVNVSSSSFFGIGSGLSYPAAKGAVLGMSRAMAAGARNKGYDIKVNSIMPVARSRLSSAMGEDVALTMERIFPPSAVAPVVAFLAHEDVPCSGETFTVGGGRYARVFFGVADGYRGSLNLTAEEVRDHFDEAVDTSNFVVPVDSCDEASLFRTLIDWSILRMME